MGFCAWRKSDDEGFAGLTFCLEQPDSGEVGGLLEVY